MMKLSIEKIISNFINEQHVEHHCYFSNHSSIPAPKLAYQVDFPRIEMIIGGEQNIIWENNNQIIQKTLYANDVLFACAKSWNKSITEEMIELYK